MVTSASGELSGLADAYWDARLAANPRTATLLGDRRFDDRIEDLTVEADERHRHQLTGLLDQLDRLDVTGLGGPDGVTAALLRAELVRDLDALGARLIELASDQLDGVHAALLTEMPMVSAPTPEAADALVDRHRQIGTMLDQALDRFRAGLATGRAPARLTIERSLRQLDGYLAAEVNADPFVTIDGPAGWSGEAAWRDELAVVAREVVRPGLARYRRMLAEELLPVARPDDRCGLSWLGDDGEETYALLIRQHTTTDDLSVTGIHELGRAAIEELSAEYAPLGARLFGTTDRAEIFDRLRDDPALRYVDGDEILADARRCLEAAGGVMDRWFGRLPASPCELDVVPGHLAADAPSAYYFPPATDGSRPGTYFVNLWEPTGRTRHDMASTAFHEGIPGHHLQLAIASELEGVPSFQRLSWSNTAFVEGWALYAERLAEEMGLYRDDLDRVGMLVNDSWRCARLVVDTGLHAMGWSRQDAIDYMVANVPVGRQELELEVDRYVAIPGQALAYKIGQLEIQRLRRIVEEREGPELDIRAFHDTVLGSGSLSLTVLRDIVDSPVAP